MGGVLTSITVTMNSQSTYREVDFRDFILRVSWINLESIEVNEKLKPTSAGLEFLPGSQINRNWHPEEIFADCVSICQTLFPI